MKTRIIGIDPGANGGLCVLYEDGGAAAHNIKCDGDTVDLLRDLSNIESGVGLVCYLELVGGYIGKPQPGSAMFKFGSNYGF